MNREEREKGFGGSGNVEDCRKPTKAIPGYTGHLRNAKDIFGAPAGKVLEVDNSGGIGTFVRRPKATAGSTFISALGADGAVWDHQYETTHQAMTGPGQGSASKAVGYTGHVHRAQDVIGMCHSEVARHSENARKEEEWRLSQQPEAEEEGKPHWTTFVADSVGKGAKTWKQGYTQTLTTRPNPRKQQVTDAQKQAAQSAADLSATAQYEAANKILGVSSPLSRSLPGTKRQDDFIPTGPKPLFLKDNTLMTEAPEEEKNYTGHFSQSLPSKRIVGYTGHLHGGQDQIGMNFGRAERRTNPHDKPAEEPHPLGSRYQNAAPAAPAASPAVRALVCAQPRAKRSGVGIVDTVRTKILQRGGRNGFRSLVRILRMMDDDGNKKLNKYELQNGLNTYGIYPNPLEMDEVMTHFDSDGSGQVSVTEFMVAVRDPMNAGRRELVQMAFGLLDKTGDGVVTFADVAQCYDAAKHPEVLAGEKTAKEVMQDFIKGWDKDGNGKVPFSEFCDYYEDISAGIDDDQYFELMMRNAWHISGGEGAAANTSCRRVVVYHTDGTQTVEEIKNDLGIGPKDENKMLANLRAQGITDIKKIALYG